MQLNDELRWRSEICMLLITRIFRQFWGRQIVRCLLKEWRGTGIFLGTGNFTELLLSISEVIVGVQILIYPSYSINYSMLLDKMEDVYPIRLAGVVWLLAGTLSLTGIYLYAIGYRTSAGYKIERLFRFLGALCSMFIWLSAGLTLSPSPLATLYYAMSLASMRTVRIVWHK